ATQLQRVLGGLRSRLELAARFVSLLHPRHGSKLLAPAGVQVSPFRLIASYSADALRGSIRTLEIGARGNSHESQYQPVQVEEATGRAKCRQCGKRIEKGSLALSFSLDNGGGSWTAVGAYIHARICEP